MNILEKNREKVMRGLAEDVVRLQDELNAMRVDHGKLVDDYRKFRDEGSAVIERHHSEIAKLRTALERMAKAVRGSGVEFIAYQALGIDGPAADWGHTGPCLSWCECSAAKAK